MSGPITRRRYLAAVGGAVALAGCSDAQRDADPHTASRPSTTPTGTLVVPADGTATVTPPASTGEESSPTATATATGTDTGTATSTPTESPEPTESQPSGGGGNGGGGGGQSSDPTATATPMPERLVIPSGGTEAETAVEFYERVVWRDTGRLVIEAGAGVGLTEAET